MIKEMVCLSDYVVDIKKKSMLIPNKEIIVGTIMFCPVCKKEQSEIQHGEKRICKCGVIMKSWGNALILYSKQPLVNIIDITPLLN